ncbi:MAG: hypothetical protein ACM3QS_02195 [Bacteroidota bacterium]
MNRPSLSSFINLWVILGALASAACLTLLTVILIGWMRPRATPQVGFVPADLTIIPAPTHTPNAPPTPTTDPLATPTLPPNTIGIGGFVQISGTEGEGLRLRKTPGLNGEALFLGLDEEVYQVTDGPQEVDGYTWWYLKSPIDETRTGWAAANFLTVVPSP